MFETTSLGPISEITFEDDTVTLPYNATDPLVMDGVKVVILGSWWEPDYEFWEDLGIELDDKKSEIGFELDNRYRNVVAFDANGTLKWIIPEAPHDPPETDLEPYYKSLWQTDGDLWVRNKNQRAYRVTPDTGDLLEDVPANHLRLGGTTIEFDNGWVGKVLHHDDVVAVMLEGANHPAPSGNNIYVFDQDGTKRWWIGDRLRDDAPAAGPPFTGMWIDDGDLCGYATDGYTYRFDLYNGDLLDQEWTK